MTIRRMSGLEVCMYTVGDVVSFPKDVDPNQKYLHTAWERIKGRVVVGVDENDADFASDNKTGGAKTHTLTVTQIPAHKHSYAPEWVSKSPSNTGAYGLKGESTDYTYSGGAGNAGKGQPHNNLQPFITKYLWERIA